MARITVEDCINKFESRFELVLVASNRARKLHSGETPTVEKNNDKNTVIALREIADETILVDEMKNSLVEEYQTLSSQDEEDLSLEFSDSEDDKNEQEVDDKNEQEVILKTENINNTDLIEEERIYDTEKEYKEEELNTDHEQVKFTENLEESKN